VNVIKSPSASVAAVGLPTLSRVYANPEIAVPPDCALRTAVI